jgi:hypothetical protein
MSLSPIRLSTFALAIAVAACGGGGTGPDDPPVGVPPAQRASSEVVLQLRPGANIDDIASAYGLTPLAQFGRRPIHRLRIAAGAAVDAVVDDLRDDARILYAEPNLESETPEGRRSSVWAIGEASAYTAQWAPQALRLPQAHAVSRGARVRVAVLDTGIDADHPALRDRLARRGDGTLLGRDFVDDDATPAEAPSGAAFGHGTHVAGIVALAAPRARIMPLRVLDAAGQGNIWVLAEALLWAVDPDGNPATDDGAHVINLSIGGLQPTRLLEVVTRLASCDVDDDDDEDDFEDAGFDDDRSRCERRHGAVVMAAAGNGGSETEEQFPAAEAARVPVPGALAVTASNEARRLWRGANRGDWVQIAAPGDGITSAIPGGRYAVWSGTSMATPLAAGTAALVMATSPAPDPQTYAGLRRWAPADLAKRVGDRSARLCGDTSLRQVDAYAAVTDASGLDPDC